MHIYRKDIEVTEAIGTRRNSLLSMNFGLTREPLA